MVLMQFSWRSFAVKNKKYNKKREKERESVLAFLTNKNEYFSLSLPGLNFPPVPNYAYSCLAGFPSFFLFCSLHLQIEVRESK